jgi:hypothetical protein
MNGLAGSLISGVAPPDSEMRAVGLPVAPEGIGPVVVQRSRCIGSPVWGERRRFGEESSGLVQARLAIPQDVLDGRSELGFPAGDPGVLLDLEPGLADGRTGVVAAVAAAGQRRVQRGVEEPFQPGERGTVGDDVLEVPELPTGTQDAADFAELWHRAQHETGDHGVVVTVVAGQVLGRAGHDLDLGARLPGCGAGPVAPTPARLDRDQPGHAGR